MKEKLFLDEHYSELIAARLRAADQDVLAVVADPELRAQSGLEVFRRAAAPSARKRTGWLSCAQDQLSAV